MIAKCLGKYMVLPHVLLAFTLIFAAACGGQEMEEEAYGETASPSYATDCAGQPPGAIVAVTAVQKQYRYVSTNAHAFTVNATSPYGWFTFNNRSTFFGQQVYSAIVIPAQFHYANYALPSYPGVVWLLPSSGTLPPGTQLWWHTEVPGAMGSTLLDLDEVGQSPQVLRYSARDTSHTQVGNVTLSYVCGN